MAGADRLARERDTIEAMVSLYCAAFHGPTAPCEGCLELLEYSRKRLEACGFGEDKPVCSRCPVHCYRKDMRERIRQVMRYAGPRMVLSHPIMAVRHWVDQIAGWRNSRRKRLRRTGEDPIDRTGPRER